MRCFWLAVLQGLEWCVWPKHSLSRIITEVAKQLHKPIDTYAHKGHLKSSLSTEQIMKTFIRALPKIRWIQNTLDHFACLNKHIKLTWVLENHLIFSEAGIKERKLPINILLSQMLSFHYPLKYCLHSSDCIFMQIIFGANLCACLKPHRYRIFHAFCSAAPQNRF